MDHKITWREFDELGDLIIKALTATWNYCDALDLPTKMAETMYPEGIAAVGEKKRKAEAAMWEKLYRMKYHMALIENKVDAE